MNPFMNQCWNVSRFNKGQALVEMAITAPILIFLLLGVFEVGWAIRNYLVLANASREAARFASRPQYLDLDAEDAGFSQVYTHAINSISDQLPTEYVTLIVSVISIDVQEVCDRANLAACDCMNVRTNPLSPTLIAQPLMPSYTHWIATFPVTSVYTTKLEFDSLSKEVAADSRQISCEITKKSEGVAILRKNELVTAELILEHHQLFGFPIWSNPYTDPIIMYGHTTMRILDARKSGSDE